MMRSKKFKIAAGFTLIEIIVSISIFTVVMLITMGALLTLNDSSRKAQALRTVIDNLNFAVEDMNRKVRTGDVYHCYDHLDNLDGLYAITADDFTRPRDCESAGGGAISLKTQEVENGKDVFVAYLFEKDASGIGRIRQRKGRRGDAILGPEELAITSAAVDIKKMDFRVIGSDSRKEQPMVILNISGVVDLKKEKLQTDFSLQTAVSRRSAD